MSFAVGGEKHLLTGTPAMIAHRIAGLMRKHKKNVDIQTVWDWLNMVWISREPGRALTQEGMPFRITEEDILGTGHLDPSFPSIEHVAFCILSVFGVKGGFDKEKWASAVGIVDWLIDPAKNESVGCDDCFGAWVKFRLEHPYEEVENEHEAAKWAWGVRNAVLEASGRRKIGFAESVLAYHWAFTVSGTKTEPVI